MYGSSIRNELEQIKSNAVEDARMHLKVVWGCIKCDKMFRESEAV